MFGIKRQLPVASESKFVPQVLFASFDWPNGNAIPHDKEPDYKETIYYSINII